MYLLYVDGEEISKENTRPNSGPGKCDLYVDVSLLKGGKQ